MKLFQRILVYFFLLCAAGISVSINAQSIYKCRDASGKLQIRDTPCKEAKTETVYKAAPISEARQQESRRIAAKIKFDADRMETERLRLPQPLATVRPASCYKATIQEPQPFLGNGGEIILLSDGSIWKNISYSYLYLYEYYPTVVICPNKGKMILGNNSFDIQQM